MCCLRVLLEVVGQKQEVMTIEHTLEYVVKHVILNEQPNVNNDENISVIVQFNALSSKTAFALAQDEGKTISLLKTDQALEEAQRSFQRDQLLFFNVFEGSFRILCCYYY